jgi:hypothetical protein
MNTAEFEKDKNMNLFMEGVKVGDIDINLYKSN